MTSVSERTVVGARRRSLGREFGWLWTAFAVSTGGTWLAFDAIPLIAVLVLHAGPAAVSALAAVGLAVGAMLAMPLGPWIEFRRKRPVMVAMDLVRFGVLTSVPLAYAFGRLGFAQLLVVSIVVAAADITFTAASGACLKALVRPEDLLVANGRFESTMWTATVLGPPLGGLAIGVLGPVTTVLADAASYLLSAVSIRAIGGSEARPVRAVRTVRLVQPPGDGAAAREGAATRLRAGDLFEGWRHLLHSATLRPLFLNVILVNGLIMATAPLLAVLMLGRLGFAPWQYGLAFAVPCIGGLIGSRLARPLASRFGQRTVLRTAGIARVCWSFGLAFIRPGVAGLVLVMVVEFGLILCCGIFNPVLATYRLEQTPNDRVARTLSAWSVTSKTMTAALTALWGVLAGVTGPRVAIGAAGALMLLTPLLLVRRSALAGCGA